ncbi:uncharacterized protein BDR25DRAFT_314622 [Lindgomyces ingoldianus]|uniref:Uncharacterized protein n=1 Tax=Lindgomyces ingoldianus TaxID=673940 RepID=A0ACB6QWG8_9PLEO|nr:uncharacterized protein BDR25DRAFT_314622 [Lindgomyces ingoldianus]KAF2470422.1 hypothetical protein BDR25DRAFT_314622 [Lindgomyces ingoldianus]
MVLKSILLPCLLLSFLPFTGAVPNRFKHWYPFYGLLLEAALRNNCSEEYNNFLHTQSPNSDWSKVGVSGGSPTNAAFTGPVISCILEALPEVTKADMAAASVLLGLMPTILAVAGSILQYTDFGH